jgi:hypothetical protein
MNTTKQAKLLKSNLQAGLVEGFSHGIGNAFCLACFYDENKKLLNAQPLGAWTFSRFENKMPCFVLSIFKYGGKGHTYNILTKAVFVTLSWPTTHKQAGLVYSLAGLPLEDKIKLVGTQQSIESNSDLRVLTNAPAVLLKMENILSHKEVTLFIGRSGGFYNKPFLLSKAIIDENDRCLELRIKNEHFKEYKGRKLDNK